MLYVNLCDGSRKHAKKVQNKEAPKTREHSGPPSKALCAHTPLSRFLSEDRRERGAQATAKVPNVHSGRAPRVARFGQRAKRLQHARTQSLPLLLVPPLPLPNAFANFTGIRRRLWLPC